MISMSSEGRQPGRISNSTRRTNMAHKNTDTFIVETGTTGREPGKSGTVVGFIFINVAYVAIFGALFLILAL
jgi:hypothetical protein